MYDSPGKSIRDHAAALRAKQHEQYTAEDRDNGADYAPVETPPAMLEVRQRLSRSKLWRWQADYFDASGVTAWAGSVPFYATSSVHIAHSYARVIARYLQDIVRRPESDAHRPVYIVELGAGSGQFAYYCVRHLVELCETLQLPAKPCWVMTDFTQSNIDFWKGQAVFQPYLDTGLLDMARFDVDAPDALSLQHSGRTVSHDSPANAVVCIANYLFDSTRHDAFHVDNGRLYEVLVSLSAPQRSVRDGRPVHLSDVEYSFDRVPLRTARYYGDPLWNEVIASYAEQPDLSGSFVFPTAVLSTLDHLEKLGGGKLMLLSSDKGYLDSEEIVGRSPPSLAMHNGCFSLTVNFDAVRRYVDSKGGRSFHQPPDGALRTCAYIQDDQDPDGYPETTAAIQHYLQSSGPGDFFSVYQSFRDGGTFDLQSFIGLLRAGFWDPHIIAARIDDFYSSLAGADDRLRRAVALGLQTAETMIYDKPGMKDYYRSLAMLHYGLGDHGSALRLFEKSRAQIGPSFQTCFNIGICNHLNSDRKAAIAAFTEARDLEKNGNSAASWLQKLDRGNGA